MKITQAILDKLTEEAKASPRLRINMDLRNSSEDQSQRMLNAIEPGSPLPIHRHQNTSETVVCLIPDTVAAHWVYLIAVAVVMAVAYVLFKMKYYHLHEEYLQSLHS